jgi:ubiquitin C-terminal hydrolase
MQQKKYYKSELLKNLTIGANHRYSYKKSQLLSVICHNGGHLVVDIHHNALKFLPPKILL